MPVKRDGASSDNTSDQSQSNGNKNQRPGVFDINTGSTAFPVSPDTQASSDAAAALKPLKTSTPQKVSGSTKLGQHIERGGTGNAPAKVRQIGWTAGEQRLLQLFTSPNKAGSKQSNPASKRGKELCICICIH